MTDPRQTYAHLAALARNQAGTPEGETAAKIAEKMRARYGPDVESETEETATVRLSFTNVYEEKIMGRVATYLGLTAYKIGYRRTDGKGMRYLDALDLEGPHSVVQLAEPMYEEYRGKVAAFLEYSLAGWMFGALPLPKPTNLDDRDLPELSEEQLRIMWAGQEAGARNSYQRKIEEKR